MASPLSNQTFQDLEGITKRLRGPDSPPPEVFRAYRHLRKMAQDLLNTLQRLKEKKEKTSAIDKLGTLPASLQAWLNENPHSKGDRSLALDKDGTGNVDMKTLRPILRAADVIKYCEQVLAGLSPQKVVYTRFEPDVREYIYQITNVPRLTAKFVFECVRDFNGWLQGGITPLTIEVARERATEVSLKQKESVEAAEEFLESYRGNEMWHWDEAMLNELFVKSTLQRLLDKDTYNSIRVVSGFLFAFCQVKFLLDVATSSKGINLEEPHIYNLPANYIMDKEQWKEPTEKFMKRVRTEIIARLARAEGAATQSELGTRHPRLGKLSRRARIIYEQDRCL